VRTSPPRRLHALMPWRAARLADLRADEELRRRVALAEERLADLKAALEDMRAQRDAWQAMAQARIRPAPVSSTVAVAVATRNGVMLPTKLELAINMKAAEGLGITFPTAILLRAD
jgi:hypothetical protein